MDAVSFPVHDAHRDFQQLQPEVGTGVAFHAGAVAPMCSCRIRHGSPSYPCIFALVRASIPPLTTGASEVSGTSFCNAATGSELPSSAVRDAGLTAATPVPAADACAGSRWRRSASAPPAISRPPRHSAQRGSAPPPRHTTQIIKNVAPWASHAPDRCGRGSSASSRNI